jgi:enoyl-CoA hydratase
MKDFDFQKVCKSNFISRNWEKVREARKPVLAAVSGYASGGGCERAMMCDLIFVSDMARFGQPEIKIGTMLDAGGTQRLPHLVGKVKANGPVPDLAHG